MNPIALTFAFLSAFFFVLLFVLFMFSREKNKKITQLHYALAQLKQSFSDLDNQAKKIVKTDLELNKRQEELDKRLNSLDALQNTSRLLSTTLDEKEIFKLIDQSLLESLSFESGMICIFSNDHIFIRFLYGVREEAAQKFISQNSFLFQLKGLLSNGQPLSSTNASEQIKHNILSHFQMEHFILAPILSKGGVIGILLVGNQSNTLTLSEGDDELISLLANQIGQALENARLFEEVYRSSQALEIRVQERTKQLEKALEEVQNINKAKSQFISAVSHELRTPLTSVKGYAAILMAGKLGEVPAAVKERLQKINNHSDNLVQLINNLLDISRIESGKISMNISVSDISELIDNVQDLLTPQMKDKNITFETELD
ncbi:MAG: GAF domain-containing protein, partial [Candidatus Omnitrophica bacterium]|nr:GAF domain-containing protein [Candidatus Omnitrophota bacterium]